MQYWFDAMKAGEMIRLPIEDSDEGKKFALEILALETAETVKSAGLDSLSRRYAKERLANCLVYNEQVEAYRSKANSNVGAA